MDTEEVVVAEIPDEDHHDESREEVGGRRRISAGPIIAIVVVVIILSGLGYYFLSGDQINDIIILDPEDVSTGDDQRHGIELEIHITGGMRPIDGTGKLEIVYDGQVMHTRDVKISSDSGSTIVDYKDFVIENGVYDIRFSMEGKSATTEYVAKMVPDNLNITFQYQNDPETDDVITMAVVTPEFTYPDPNSGQIVIGDSLFYYNWNYELETTIIQPVGEPIVTEKSMWDYHRNRTYTNVRVPFDGEYMGNYTFSAKLINNLVKDNSPYKELVSEPEELVKYLNRPPVLGEISYPSRIRQGSEVTFTLRAADPDTNGEIVSYAIDWDYDATTDEDPDTVSELQVVYVAPGGSTTVRVKHTFPEAGNYRIAVTCADNGYIKYLPGDDIDPKNYYQKYDTEILTIVVTYL